MYICVYIYLYTVTIDKLEDQSDLLNLLPWLQCSASLGTTCFHSCQLQAGIFLQLLWAVFQGSTLLLSATFRWTSCFSLRKSMQTILFTFCTAKLC